VNDSARAGDNSIIFNIFPFYLMAAFIFFSPTMPMPGISSMGFLSPALAILIGSTILYNLLCRYPLFIINNYVLGIMCCYATLIISDIFCVLIFEFKTQFPYLIARVVTLTLFIVSISFRPSLDLVEKMIRIYCVSIMLLSILVILEGFSVVSMGAETARGRTYFGVQLPFRKAVGFPMSDGEFGIMVSPAFLYLLLQFFGGPGYRRMPFSLIGVFLTGFALLVAQSRSTWLGLALSLTVIGLLLPRRNIDRLIIVTMGLAFTAFVGSQIYGEIFAGFTSEGILAKNVNDRFETFGIVSEILRQSPLFGVGHGDGVSSGTDLSLDKAIHNHFISALSSGGLIAAIPALGLYIMLISTMLGIARDNKTSNEIRLLSIWMTSSAFLIVTELWFYRGFYSEHLPWLLGISCMIVGLHRGYRAALP